MDLFNEYGEIYNEDEHAEAWMAMAGRGQVPKKLNGIYRRTPEGEFPITIELHKQEMKQVEQGVSRLLSGDSIEFQSFFLRTRNLINHLQDLGYTYKLRHRYPGNYLAVWFKHETLDELMAVIELKEGFKRGFRVYKIHKGDFIEDAKLFK